MTIIITGFCVDRKMPAWRMTILVSHVQSVSVLSSLPLLLQISSHSQPLTQISYLWRGEAIGTCRLPSFTMQKQNVFHSDHTVFGLKCDGLIKSIKTSAFPRWIWRSNGVRLSFLRADASSYMSLINKSCTRRAKSLGQEIQADLSDENEDDLCPVECVTEFKTDDELLRVLEKAKETNSLVVVDFYRPSCGSCKYIEQGFSKLCKQSGDQEAPVIFLKHNVIDEYDEQSEVAERLRIKSVPLFHFYRNGALLEAFATRDKERIDASILKYTSSESSSTSD